MDFRKIILMCAILLICNVKINAQLKINTNVDVDIFLLEGDISLNKLVNSNEPYLFKIVNKTNKNYIIDPYGFNENNLVADCKENTVNPLKTFLNGYYKRFDDEQCSQDFIILHANEVLITPLSILSLRGSYNLDPNRKYFFILNSRHDRYKISISECSNYIQSLEIKGYELLEDTIATKILLTK